MSQSIKNPENMNRREFNNLMGLGTAGILLPALPAFSRNIAPEALLETGMDVATKKRLADAALNAAKSKGATYTDVRIGRYLNQFVVTREDKVQNIVNTESYGVGVVPHCGGQRQHRVRGTG